MKKKNILFKTLVGTVNEVILDSDRREIILSLKNRNNKGRVDLMRVGWG